MSAALASSGCGDDDDGANRDGGEDSGTSVDGGGTDDGGGPPADGRLPGAPGDSARDAVDFWQVTEPQAIDVNPELEGLLTSATRALAVVTEDATVGDVNAALDAAGMRIVGGLPGGILVVDIAEPDFAALRAAVQTLAGSGAFTTAGEDMATVSGIVPPDSESFAESGQGHVGNADWPWKWDTPPDGANWHLEWVRAPAVWNLVRVLERQKCGNLDPVVGVVDAGMHPHPDLTRVSWTYAEDSWIPGDPNEGDHALVVAGMIAAGTPSNDDRGIEGVNPWARIVGQGVPELDLADGAANLLVGTAARVVSTTGSLQEGVAALLAANPGLRIVNLSHNWPWAAVGYNPDWRNRTLIDAAVDSGALETLAFIEGLVADGHDFVLFNSAGNDRDDFGGNITARWSSPFAAAALDLGGAAAAHVLVIEAIGRLAGGNGWETRPSAFSQSEGDLSAPGEHLGVIRSPGPYDVQQGTSEASPLAAGVASLVTMFDPNAGSAGIIDALRRSTFRTGVGARPGVNALGAVLSLDRGAACGTWKKAMVDVDDGTEHGLQRWIFDDGGRGRIDTGDSGPDGVIDMADFRAFRTASDHWFPGLGPADHPKLDLNRNGRTWSANQDPEDHARFDFNGDGRIDTAVDTDTQELLGDPTTDLDLLRACFTDNGEGWSADDLDDLVASADLLFRLQWVAAEVSGHLANRTEELELEAIEIRWPTANGTHSRRLEVPLPKELLMTVPLSGGPLEVVAFAGGREVCTKLAPQNLQPQSSDHVVVPIHVECAAGETCCDDGCHDLRWDDANCGDCGLPCADGDVCDDGRCRPAGTCGPVENPIDCDLPEGRCCDGACYPPTDQMACEGCDSPCDWNEPCCAFTCCPHGSNCCPGDPTQCCAWGEDVCNGARIDVTADPLNCGGCANACPDGWECCSGLCVNVAMDRMNCGGCEVGCMPSEACCDGTCTSMAPATSCGGCPGVSGQDCTLLDTGCCQARICGTEGCPATCTEEVPGLTCDPATGQYYDLLSDSANCGGFAVTCPNHTRCVNGQCVSPEEDNDSDNCFWTGLACPDEVPVCCEGRCTDLQSDRENCGECGHGCPFGFDWSCCDGVCVNTETDHDNCRTCGQACADDEQCCDSQCVDVTTNVANCGACGYHCPQLLPLRPWQEVDWQDPWPQPVPACCDAECPPDTPAYDEENCGGCGIQCEEGQTCCAGACVDAMTDEQNCGFCHNPCAETQDCCGGRCLDTLTDRNNCGDCGNACGLFESCMGGGCVCEAI